MDIELEYDKCDSHGNCLIEAPEVFDLDEDDIVTLVDGASIEANWANIERAAAACPVAAIHLRRRSNGDNSSE